MRVSAGWKDRSGKESHCMIGGVLILGGGDTAMDCARTARRLGAAVLPAPTAGRKRLCVPHQKEITPGA